MSSVNTLTAREAYHDCLRVFEESIKPTLTENFQSQLNSEFNGELEPLSEFKIKLKITHRALITIVTRYPAADLTFHQERQPLPDVDEADIAREPLNALYTVVTVDFTPYGTIFGGTDDDNGGNAPLNEASHQEAAIESPAANTPPTTEQPTGLGGRKQSSQTATPATA